MGLPLIVFHVERRKRIRRRRRRRTCSVRRVSTSSLSSFPNACVPRSLPLSPVFSMPLAAGFSYRVRPFSSPQAHLALAVGLRVPCLTGPVVPFVNASWVVFVGRETRVVSVCIEAIHRPSGGSRFPQRRSFGRDCVWFWSRFRDLAWSLVTTTAFGRRASVSGYFSSFGSTRFRDQ